MSVPPATRRKPSDGQSLGEGGSVADDPCGVVTELRLERLAEGHGLGRDDVLERAALQPGEHGRVDRLGEVGAAKDGAAPRAAKRLVRGEGDHVGDADRVRVRLAGDEPGGMGGVEHEPRPDLVGDLAERQRVDGARVGGGPGDDELRALALGEVAHHVEVDPLARTVRRGRGDAVGDEAVELAGDRHGRAVGEVTALVEAHGQDRVAGLDERQVGGQVGVRARVRLHVGVLGAEQLGRPGPARSSTWSATTLPP